MSNNSYVVKGKVMSEAEVNRMLKEIYSSSNSSYRKLEIRCKQRLFGISSREEQLAADRLNYLDRIVFLRKRIDYFETLLLEIDYFYDVILDHIEVDKENIASFEEAISFIDEELNAIV